MKELQQQTLNINTPVAGFPNIIGGSGLSFAST
jgi:hypothetical protein